MPAKMGNVYSVPGSRFHDGAFGIDFEFFAVYSNFYHKERSMCCCATVLPFAVKC
jgi:hypothetical protein